MRVLASRKWVIATIAIATLMLSLGFVQLTAGLSATANLVEVLSVVASVIGGLLAWARTGAKPAPAENRHSPGRGRQLQPGRRSGQAQGAATGQQFPPSARSTTFRTPVPWAKWLTFWLLAVWLVTGISPLIVGTGDFKNRADFLHFGLWVCVSPVALMIFVEIVCLVILQKILMLRAVWELGRWLIGLFDFPEVLVVGEHGIAYWSRSGNCFEYSWQDVALISFQMSRSPAQLFITLKGRTKGSTMNPGEAVLLCEIDVPGFPANEIYAAMAGYHPEFLVRRSRGGRGQAKRWLAWL